MAVKKGNSTNFLGCRLSPGNDQDIINDITRFTDRTNRIKEIYRKGLEAEKLGFAPDTAPQSIDTSTKAEKLVRNIPNARKEAKKVLDWSNFPTEPTVGAGAKAQETDPVDKVKQLKSNLLKNNF